MREKDKSGEKMKEPEDSPTKSPRWCEPTKIRVSLPPFRKIHIYFVNFISICYFSCVGEFEVEIMFRIE
jgi:hypothetical protein